MIHFIGVYDYTVVLTYIGLMFSVFGMTQAIHSDYKMAIFCLAMSGICDTFDGRIARTKKNRTEDEKSFGIQLDSLCDVVCFGIFPALICYLLGVRGTLGLAIVFFYCTCAVFLILLHGVLAVVGFLFILDFQIPKPTLKTILAMIAFVAVTVSIIFAYTRFRLPSPKDESNQIVNEIIEEINETDTP